MNSNLQIKVNEIDYEALTKHAAILVRPEAGVLKITGDDRRDFLHRITTNHVNDLGVGHSVVNVLTSPVARLMFVFAVVAQEDALLLLPVAGSADALARNLRGQIFFMDKVKIADQSEQFVRMRYLGLDLQPLAAMLQDAIPSLNLAEMLDGAWLDLGAGLIVKQHNIEVPGFELLVPRSDHERWIGDLVANGVHRLADPTAYTARRIELGRPASDHELTDAYNPLEVGLGWACADDKGCYTGQEIIARQVTYDKVTKRLVGIRSGENLLPEGADLSSDKRTVGKVTSSAFSPALDTHVALAVVRRPHHESGTVLTVEGQVVTIVDLPFCNE